MDKPRKEESVVCWLPGRAAAKPILCLCADQIKVPLLWGRKLPWIQPFSWTPCAHHLTWPSAHHRSRSTPWAFPDPPRTCEANEVPAGTWKSHDCSKGWRDLLLVAKEAVMHESKTCSPAVLPKRETISCLMQRFSTWANFAPWDICQCLETLFGGHSLEGSGVCSWHLVSGGQGYC